MIVNILYNKKPPKKRFLGVFDVGKNNKLIEENCQRTIIVQTIPREKILYAKCTNNPEWLKHIL